MVSDTLKRLIDKMLPGYFSFNSIPGYSGHRYVEIIGRKVMPGSIYSLEIPVRDQSIAQVFTSSITTEVS